MHTSISVISGDLGTFLESPLLLYFRQRVGIQGPPKGGPPDGAGPADEGWPEEGPADPWGSSGWKERESLTKSPGVFLRYVDA